jgi:hypothetical protein
MMEKLLVEKRVVALELVGAIATVMQHMIEQSSCLRHFTPYPLDVSEGWVSFHHALLWLLAELCKHVGWLTEEKLRAVGVQGGLKGVFLRMDEQAMLNVMDFPLRGTCLLLNFYPHAEICITQS